MDVLSSALDWFKRKFAMIPCRMDGLRHHDSIFQGLSLRWSKQLLLEKLQVDIFVRPEHGQVAPQ